MNKLPYAAIGVTALLVWAPPAFAQSVPTDMATAIQNRAAISRDMADLAAEAGGSSTVASDEAVLGASALPSLGFDAPLQVKVDMMTSLRADAAKNRALKFVPGGESLD
jgi:hypothetical protein